jgi:transcriptional regulator with PAS, ATPase and Fis domain
MTEIMLNTVVNRMHTEGLSMHAALLAFKRAWIGQALKRNSNNQCKLAAEMGVHRNTVARVIKQAEVSVGSRKKPRLQASVVSTCEERKTA